MRPKTFLATDHDIDHSQIDVDALDVIDRLKNAGHKAYLVGGGVRDLLARKNPKDFDISTSARPEEIKDIFKRRCILIGRRFRLAHIRFGHKIIEVATFRSGDNESDLIIRDNTWGTEEEDVLRRDFTINGLFYDPTNHTVIDYVGGWEDIHRGLIKTIGDPFIRFKQDPVRMIRLLKFRARFGFEIDPQTKKALLQCQGEIFKSSPARILEEVLRMLESGASAQFFFLMSKSGILKLIFPALADFLEGKESDKIYVLLEVADRINQNHYALDRAVLTSCLLFPILEQEIEAELTNENPSPHLGQIITACATVIKEVLTSSFSHFPRRISTTMNTLMSMQYRLTPLSGKRRFRNKLLAGKEFPLALKFLKIRALANKELMTAYTSWKNVYRQFQKQALRKGHPHHPPPLKDRE